MFKLFKWLSKFLDSLTEFDRQMAEEGYIIHYPPPGAGSLGGMFITYVGKPNKPNSAKKKPRGKSTYINTRRHDRAGTISESNPGS
ncbi:uncharacterized protein METZ01_LOCUS373348 [marine metagenome]|uniref:Uncharacterized protein n=1 Tax=marine metagenome TaxID=408172 RepID=A0A382TEF5_9ZZZZ